MIVPMKMRPRYLFDLKQVFLHLNDTFGTYRAIVQKVLYVHIGVDSPTLPVMENHL